MTEQSNHASQDPSWKFEEEPRPEDLQAGSALGRLIKVRDALKVLATGQENDGATLKRSLCVLGGYLDSALGSLQSEQQQVQFEQQQAQWQAQQAACDLDMERARSRIEPLKPSPPGGPHRIDWKGDIGF